jgi:putative hemolysin
MIWLVVAICLLISFVFSGIEAGILSVNRVRLAHYAKLRTPHAVHLSRLLEHPERLLVNVLIVTNLMNIFAVVLTTRQIVQNFEAKFSHGRFAWEAYLLAFAICLPVYLFVFNLLPKAIFRRFPYRALALFSNVLRVSDVLLSPVLKVVERIAASSVPEGGGAARKLFVAREEFKYFTIEGERVGTLTRLERDMIHNIVDFRSVTAQDVMIPMDQVRSIGEEASIEKLLALSREHDIDRFPVISRNGRITGLVNVFDVLLDRADYTNVGVYQRRIVAIRPEDLAYSVIRKLRAAHLTLAAVFDGNGKAVGIVSAEDLISQLVRAAIPPASSR